MEIHALFCYLFILLMKGKDGSTFPNEVDSKCLAAQLLCTLLHLKMRVLSKHGQDGNLIQKSGTLCGRNETNILFELQNFI